MYDYREFQAISTEKLMEAVEKGYHPLVAIPTGAGKTIIITRFIYMYLEKNPKHNVLVISHTEDIVRQDHKTICNIFEGIKIGLYSAGLKSKTISKITVAGIQSIYRKAKLFKDFDLIIIDEAHLIQRKKRSMYQMLFDVLKPSHIKVGLSATIFRCDSGFLHKGHGAVFNNLAYDLSSADNFLKLIEDGYLCKLISRCTDLELDTEGLKKTAGDYNQKDMVSRFDREGITNQAIDEIIQYGQNYKSWLIFAINIAHADHICQRLNELGIHARVLHTKSGEDRQEIAEDFKAFKFRALVSVGMITTGFDAPNVDLIGMLRPTLSPVLHVQMAGRGTRPYPGKDHCLYLDFGGNVGRLGAINNVRVPKQKDKKDKEEKLEKVCPQCRCYIEKTARVCPFCDYVFPVQEQKQRQERLRNQAGDQDIIEKAKKPIVEWIKVDDVSYQIYEKYDKPKMLKVMYQCGIQQINEFVCIEHNGYPKLLADHWVKVRWTAEESPPPSNVEDLYMYSDFLRIPSQIQIVENGRYLNVKDVIF